MQKAINLAHEAGGVGEVPIGAIIVSSGEIIGKGFNQTITKKDPTAHAEVVAIKDACRNINNQYLPKDSALYVTLAPCIMCYGAILHARVRHVCYGAYSDKHIQNNLNVTSGIKLQECENILKNYFKLKRLK